MRRFGHGLFLLLLGSATFGPALVAQDSSRAASASEPTDEESCRALLEMPTLTITTASLKPAVRETPAHCQAYGLIAGRIRFVAQLPLRSAWNGRLLNVGDGGKDGAVNLSNSRVAQGYAVANSNMGHDAGAQPNATFGTNLEALTDFGHRAVHLTANASKALVRAYYGRAAAYTYFEGCSTGGREGLMEAQRYPEDFDGIVAGAPVYDYAAVNITHVWLAQRMFRDRFAGNLAFDRDNDGVPESLTKFHLLRDAVLAKCDAADGIRDGLIDDPLACDFRPEVDLAAHACRGDVNGDACFTTRQMQTINDLYRGPHDSRGRQIRKGFARGSEFEWDEGRIPHKGNNLLPRDLGYGIDHFNFLFYKESPGVPPPIVNDPTYPLDKKATPPEYGWWEFNVDDMTSGQGAFMAGILEATQTDLTRFLIRGKGKLLLYHGWGDSVVGAEQTLDYYKQVVDATFKGNLQAARESARLFMVPGMSHCFGGPGCDDWDRLAPMVDWVEKGIAPDALIARHLTKGVVDNERRICPYPERATYVGPPGGQDDRANWKAVNFRCG
jgi:feruloyl esterase